MSANCTAVEPLQEMPREQPSGVWSAIRDALRGVPHDYTAGALGRALLLLAIPMVIEMVMESIFAVVDVFFVARLGPDAVATVGLTESMLSLVYAVAMGLSIGVSATVARRIGEKDPDAAARTAVQGIAIGLGIAIVLGVVGLLFAPQLLAVVGGAPEVVRSGSGFTRVMLGANGVILMLFLINAIFRGAGDAAISMRVLWLANGLNCILDPCLIYGFGPFPKMGVTGAAVATTIGRGAGVVLQFYMLSRRGGRIAIRGEHLEIDLERIRGILRLSATAALQVLIGTASWIGLVRVLSRFGSAALAGYTIGIRILLFALLPSWGLANAASTLVGQALGAEKPDRAASAAWRAGLYNMFFLTAVGGLFFGFAAPLARIFSDGNPEVVALATSCMRMVSLGFPFYGYGMVLTQAFNGAGDTWTPTLINLGCFWLLEIPLAYLLAVPAHLGPTGAYLAITFAFSTVAVVSALLFRRGTWKLRKV
jgi:putative MATE family efflux protein